MKIDYLQKVNWEDIRKEVAAVNPELSKIIDDIDPGKKFKFIKAHYKFGDLIIKDGKLQIPDHFNISAHDKKSILEELSYTPIPLTLFLNKASEAFVTEGERVIPLKLLNPGKFFGTFETLNSIFGKNSRPAWNGNVSAGSRSIFTLPKISTSAGLKRLKGHFKLSPDTRIHSLADHWHLFKQISNHDIFQEGWVSNVIFFTKDWFLFKKKDDKWFKFFNYLFREGWFQIQQVLDREPLAKNWQAYIKAISSRRIKVTPYMADTLKHLLLISIGEAPAFQIVNTNISAPVKEFQKIILDIYLLEKHIPTIMNCRMPDQNEKSCYYYSLAFPTLFEGSPASKNSSSTIMGDIKVIKMLIDTLQRDHFSKDVFFMGNKFDYFHVEDDAQNEIKSSRIICQSDVDFSSEMKKFTNRSFCTTSPFWRGCIRIKV